MAALWQGQELGVGGSPSQSAAEVLGGLLCWTDRGEL